MLPSRTCRAEGEEPPWEMKIPQQAAEGLQLLAMEPLSCGLSGC